MSIEEVYSLDCVFSAYKSESSFYSTWDSSLVSELLEIGIILIISEKT